MNVQLTGNPGTNRPRTRTAERVQVSVRPPEAAASTPIAERFALAVQDQQLWLASGLFGLVAGWIIINSGWSADKLGYPMMLLGLLLPLVPFVAQYRANRAIPVAPFVPFSRDSETGQISARRQVYDLNSADYSSVS